MDAATIILIGIPCELLPNPAGKGYTDLQIHTWTRSEEAVIEVPSRKLKLSWTCQNGAASNEASVWETALDVYQGEW